MASRRMREEGRVVVLVEINNQGLVVSARRFLFRFAAPGRGGADRHPQGRFKPYTRNGVAYAAKAKIPFDFVMRN